MRNATFPRGQGSNILEPLVNIRTAGSRAVDWMCGVPGMEDKESERGVSGLGLHVWLAGDE
jgi:hypothetical protein